MICKTRKGRVVSNSQRLVIVCASVDEGESMKNKKSPSHDNSLKASVHSCRTLSGSKRLRHVISLLLRLISSFLSSSSRSNNLLERMVLDVAVVVDGAAPLLLNVRLLRGEGNVKRTLLAEILLFSLNS